MDELSAYKLKPAVYGRTVRVQTKAVLLSMDELSAYKLKQAVYGRTVRAQIKACCYGRTVRVQTKAGCLWTNCQGTN